jgi:hypothetical protein
MRLDRNRNACKQPGNDRLIERDRSSADAASIKRKRGYERDQRDVFALRKRLRGENEKDRREERCKLGKNIAREKPSARGDA